MVKMDNQQRSRNRRNTEIVFYGTGSDLSFFYYTINDLLFDFKERERKKEEIQKDRGADDGERSKNERERRVFLKK